MSIQAKLRTDQERSALHLQRIFKMQIELLQYLAGRNLISPSDHLDRLLRLAATSRMDAACAEILFEAMRTTRAQQPAPQRSGSDEHSSIPAPLRNHLSGINL